MFSYFSTNPIFDFVANILSNVSALKDGRLFMLDNKFLPRLMEMLKSGKLN
jgi:hypothetical protein